MCIRDRADLFVGALDDPLVADRRRDQADLPALVAVDLGRRPLRRDLAQALAEPVDAGQRREGVVDGGRERADRDLDKLVDGEAEVLSERAVGACQVGALEAARDRVGGLRRPDGRQRVACLLYTSIERISGRLRDDSSRA